MITIISTRFTTENNSKVQGSNLKHRSAFYTLTKNIEKPNQKNYKVIYYNEARHRLENINLDESEDDTGMRKRHHDSLELKESIFNVWRLYHRKYKFNVSTILNEKCFAETVSKNLLAETWKTQNSKAILKQRIALPDTPATTKTTAKLKAIVQHKNRNKTGQRINLSYSLSIYEQGGRIQWARQSLSISEQENWILYRKIEIRTFPSTIPTK